jgi:putative acyl-CoA dehydrogenase
VKLDVLRSMQREPETVDVFLDELAQARGANARLDAFADDLGHRLVNSFALEPIARRVVEMMAFALQASLLVRYSSAAVADAFCSTRLDGDWGRAFGTMPQGLGYPGNRRPRPDRRLIGSFLLRRSLASGTGAFLTLF